MMLRLSCLVTAVWLLGGCGQGISGEPVGSRVDPAGSELAAFYPCTALTDAEVQALGFRSESRTQTETLGLVGCAYVGPGSGLLGSLAVNKEPEDTVASYAARGDTFGGFRNNEVNGRRGAQIQVAEDNTDCTQLVDAGSGTVQVNWSVRGPGVMDPCAEALRVMQMIEPQLPAPGS